MARRRDDPAGVGVFVTVSLAATSAVTGAAFAALAAGLCVSPRTRWAVKWAAFLCLLTGGPAAVGAAVGFDLDDPAKRAEVLFQAALFNLASLGGVAGLTWLDWRASGGRQPPERRDAAERPDRSGG